MGWGIFTRVLRTECQVAAGKTFVVPWWGIGVFDLDLLDCLWAVGPHRVLQLSIVFCREMHGPALPSAQALIISLLHNSEIIESNMRGLKTDIFQRGDIYSPDGHSSYFIIYLIRINFKGIFQTLSNNLSLVNSAVSGAADPSLSQTLMQTRRGPSLIITVRMWRSSQIEMSSPAFCLDGFTLLSLAHGACLTSPLTHSLQASRTLAASGFPASGAGTVCQSQGSYDHKVFFCHTVHHLYSSLFVLFL